jgi:RNase P subunit RPR2
MLCEEMSYLVIPQVSPKGQIQLPVEFKSRFLRPCTATLVLVGKRAGSACGSTLVFNLRTSVDNITPRVCEELWLN